ncbi:uncharacterized protein LOC129791854 [Lutzomyia longipalpis]|uniref:uncharacterized protein LOC129791854 n=1 Tax=Lutzomyia longipalpis TaxID=7200 RepID=UPI00248440F8|nr:uncharacterized protein LOC129791854 [Lutzomyia longipalpis]
MSEITSGVMNQETEVVFEKLRSCFETRRAVLILPGDESIAIWTRDDHFAYFAFIPSRESLFLVAKLEDLVTTMKFIFNSDTFYRICEMEVTKLEEASTGMIPDNLPGRGYVEIDEDLAILRGTLQLGTLQASNGDSQGLFAGYTAIIFAHATPLNSWDSDTLDRVLMMSESLTRKSLNAGKTKFSYFVSCGPFRVHLDTEITFYRDFAEILEDRHHLERTLAAGWSLVMEFSGIYWTIMLQNIFYLFNPYENSNAFGSSLQMHQNLRNVLGIVGSAVGEDSKATVHIVRIVSCEEAGSTTPTTQNPEIPEELEEVERALEMWDQDGLASQEELRENQEEKERQMKELTEELKKKRKDIQMKLKRAKSHGDYHESPSSSVSERISSCSSLSNTLNPPQNTPSFHRDVIQDVQEMQEVAEMSRESQGIAPVQESSQEGSIMEFSDEFPESPFQENNQIPPTGKTFEIPIESVPQTGKTFQIPTESVPSTGKTFEMHREPLPPSRDTSPSETIAKDNLVVLQSSTGSRESLSKLLRKGLTLSSRFLITTPKKRFLLFHRAQHLFLYRGCICNVRHFPIGVTDEAKFLRFRKIHEVITHIRKANADE